MTPPRDLLLTERRPRLCRLPPGEAEFLRAHHPAALDLAPTATRHLYRVTPAGVAGVIVTPWRRVVISPKLPLSNVLHLLDPRPALGQEDHVTPADGRAVLDLLAALLLNRLSERAAAGLHRGYRELDRQGPYLLGRLDVPAQLRQAPGRRDQLHCRHDDFTLDLPCHQLPRAAASLLAASPLLNEATRSRLRSALAALAGVSDVPLAQALHQPAVPDGYGPLLDLCRLLADQIAPTPAAGPAAAPALLVSLERIFEQYVARAAREAFEGRAGEVAAQQTTLASAPPGLPPLSIRPDVVVRLAGEAIALDAKWKRFPADALHTDDVYQALAYGTLLAARRAVLVYPGRRRPREYTFAHSPLTLEVRGLDVAGRLDRLRAARLRLQRHLRRHLRGAGSATRP